MASDDGRDLLAVLRAEFRVESSEWALSSGVLPSTCRAAPLTLLERLAAGLDRSFDELLA